MYVNILVYIINSEYEFNINYTIDCCVCIVLENISVNEFDYFRVAEGGRRKSFIIFVVIIAVVWIIAAAATLAFVFTKNDSITNQQGSE